MGSGPEDGVVVRSILLAVWPRPPPMTAPARETPAKMASTTIASVWPVRPVSAQ
jgi:hypothetical protein